MENTHNRKDDPGPGGYREAYAAARAELAEVREERRELAFRCERLEAALAAASDGVWDLNLINGRIHCSEGWSRMLGREPGDGIESVEEFMELVHPDDQVGLEASIQRHLTGGSAEAYRASFRLKHHGGHWVSVLSRGAVVRDHRGEVVRFIGTHVDLSACAEAARIGLAHPAPDAAG